MVTVGIATMPGREENLRVVIEALLPQADYMVVYSNDPAGPPEWIEEYDRLMAVGPIHGDLTDAGKLYGLDVVWGGYYLVCDDDLFYPPDYVKQIVWGIEKYGRGRVVGYSGGILADPPIAHYYRDGRTKRWHWKEDVPEDAPCNLLLTCLAGWHMDLLDGWTWRDCEEPKMLDIHLAIECQRRGVGMTVLSRPAGWITHQEIDHSKSIFGEMRNADEAPTAKINEYGKPFRIL